MKSEEAATSSRSVSPVSTPQVRVLAPAKINLVLRVLDRRSDGFHAIWSLMQTVELCDDLHIAIHPATPPVVELRCDDMTLPADQTNLVYRAAALVLERTRRQVRVVIDLQKRIPMGAGLGGGSSDAAATILGLNYLLDMKWTRPTMEEIGQLLGSDVPFFFAAPTAVATGRGERVVPVELPATRWIVLVNPGFPVDTGWAYRQLSSSRTEVRPISEALRGLEQKTVLTWDEIVRLAENDFEAPVFSAHAILAEIKARLISGGAESALLSGSGATVFGLFADQEKAMKAQASLQMTPQFKVYAVETCRHALTCL
ncbi:MAG: 4-(cytidine 5'-diphospho)-2-C-methyl-D-erythritol kinase [Nitrospiraceae bacterium]